jgi:CHASE2 domain-containing sensor protein
VRGKKMMIGATALELGDEFATPVGLLPGVIIHALAYESIADGGRALISLSPLALLILCAGLVADAYSLCVSGVGALRGLVLRHLTALALIIVTRRSLFSGLTAGQHRHRRASFHPDTDGDLGDPRGSNEVRPGPSSMRVRRA